MGMIVAKTTIMMEQRELKSVEYFKLMV